MSDEKIKLPEEVLKAASIIRRLGYNISITPKKDLEEGSIPEASPEDKA